VVLAWFLMLGAPSVGVMAGCVLVRACVQHLWKGKKALQARYGSQRKYVRHRFNVARCAQIAAGCAPVLLAVMMAGCVLVSRAFGRGRIHCKQEVLQKA